MATRKREPEILEHDVFTSPPQSESRFPVTAGDPLDLGESLDDVESLNKVLDELGAEDGEGGFVTVYRIRTTSGGKREEAFIDRFPVTEFTLADLKEKRGAGTYKITVYRPNGKGIAARKVIPIEADPVEQHTSSPQPGVDVSAILHAIQQSNREMMQALQATVLSMNKPVQSRMEMMQEMAMMKELFSAGQQLQFNPVEMLKTGVELAQMSGAGGGGDGNGLWIAKAIETLQPMFAVMAAKALQPSPVMDTQKFNNQLAQPALPVAQNPAIPAQPSPVNNSEDDMNLIMRGYISMIGKAALANDDVEKWADNILSTVSDAQLADLKIMLNDPNYLAVIGQFTPAAQQNPAWFESLRDTLLSYIAEDEGLTNSLTGNINPLHADADTANSKPSDNGDLANAARGSSGDTLHAS